MAPDSSITIITNRKIINPKSTAEITVSTNHTVIPEGLTLTGMFLLFLIRETYITKLTTKKAMTASGIIVANGKTKEKPNMIFFLSFAKFFK